MKTIAVTAAAALATAAAMTFGFEVVDAAVAGATVEVEVAQ